MAGARALVVARGVTRSRGVMGARGAGERLLGFLRNGLRVCMRETGEASDTK